MLNLYIVCELKLLPYSQTNDFAVTHCLFGDVHLTKNTDSYKYSYCGYGIGLDVHLTFSLSDGSGLVKSGYIFWCRQ